MKNLAFILIFLFFSCKKSDDSIKVYSWKEYIAAENKTPKKKIIVIDTICPFEIQRAKKDIAKNRLVYYCRESTPQAVKELNSITKKYNISSVYTGSSCIPPPEGFTEYCYENIMLAEIEKRHGKNWIDSLRTVALKNYMVKHPNEPYIENGIDLRAKYLNK